MTRNFDTLDKIITAQDSSVLTGAPVPHVHRDMISRGDLNPRSERQTCVAAKTP